MSVASEVARRLLQIKAIKLDPQNPFTWASGIKSPIYCDNRLALSYPKVRDYLIYTMSRKAIEMGKYDVVAGVATSGIAYGALIASDQNKPMIYVRSKAKAHGRQNLIEGHLEGNEKVLIIEDLISTGGSSLKAVEAVRATGCEVVGVVAIFSYGFEKAFKAFAEAECPMETLSNYRELLSEAVKSEYITEAQHVDLEKWSADPEAWGASQQ